MLNSKKNSEKYAPGFRNFVLKTIVFVLVFIALSYLIGQKVVESDLLYGFGLWIYGGMGYILLFSVFGFILLYRERLMKVENFRRRGIDWLILFISLILVAFFYFIELNVDRLAITAFNIIAIHLLFLIMLVLLVIGIYGLAFISYFLKKFRKEVIYFALFGILAYSLMQQVWKLWPYLSKAVSVVVYFLLNLISDNVRFVAPDIIYYHRFGAKIAEACSGIYSVFLFTSLYLFIVLMDWRSLNKKKALLMFIPALLGAFAVNIFRVFLLMIVGAQLSKELALGLYHSYTGTIFFLIYFILFWTVFYKWMKK